MPHEGKDCTSVRSERFEACQDDSTHKDQSMTKFLSLNYSIDWPSAYCPVPRLYINTVCSYEITEQAVAYQIVANENNIIFCTNLSCSKLILRLLTLQAVIVMMMLD